MNVRLQRMLGELEPRNRDNVSRTDSYLELYAYTRANPPDLPWLLMAHYVSRNGGYAMTDVAASIARGDGPVIRPVEDEVFLLLERCNFLIFYDAWHHVLMHLLARTNELSPPRTPRFICEAWTQYERAPDEERLVDALVVNEQSIVERRVVRDPRFSRALAVVALTESTFQDRPLMIPVAGSTPIRVGQFAAQERRVDAGRLLYHREMRTPAQRDALFRWALAHPHTGARADYGGEATPTLRAAWPVARLPGSAVDAHDVPVGQALW